MAFGDLGGCPKLSILVSLKFIDYQYEIVQLCSTDLFFFYKGQIGCFGHYTPKISFGTLTPNSKVQ